MTTDHHDRPQDGQRGAHPMKYTFGKRDERVITYHEDDLFHVELRAVLDYDNGDMWTTVTTRNKRNDESKRWIFNAAELGKAKYCFEDQLRLLF